MDTQQQDKKNSQGDGLTEAYVNRITTAVPPYDVNQAFLGFGQSLLECDPKSSTLFDRMAKRTGIEHRYSYLSPDGETEKGGVSASEFYVRGKFPSTGVRMRLYETEAPKLAEAAIEKLDLGRTRKRITHLVLTSCTGFSVPGLDLQIMARCSLPDSTERTIVGFMGCYGAINAMKLARHIVRSEPASRVLVVNLELCTLHFQETASLDQILSFLIFSDGCAAALVTADPVGLAMDSFRAVLVPDTGKLITWHKGYDRWFRATLGRPQSLDASASANPRSARATNSVPALPQQLAAIGHAPPTYTASGAAPVSMRACRRLRRGNIAIRHCG